MEGMQYYVVISEIESIEQSAYLTNPQSSQSLYFTAMVMMPPLNPFPSSQRHPEVKGSLPMLTLKFAGGNSTCISNYELRHPII